MEKNIEKEYKILVSKEQFELLLKDYPQAEFKEQINTYYDTKDMDILNHHGAMRIREKDGFIFTLKKWSEQGLLEYECMVPENSSSVFTQPDIKELLASFDLHGPYYEIAQLVTKRAMIISDVAELCFDISEYHGITDYEIEYEYKKDHDGLIVFQKLLDKAGLVYHENCISKIQRAVNTR